MSRIWVWGPPGTRPLFERGGGAARGPLPTGCWGGGAEEGAEEWEGPRGRGPFKAPPPSRAFCSRRAKEAPPPLAPHWPRPLAPR